MSIKYLLGRRKLGEGQEGRRSGGHRYVHLQLSQCTKSPSIRRLASLRLSLVTRYVEPCSPTTSGCISGVTGYYRSLPPPSVSFACGRTEHNVKPEETNDIGKLLRGGWREDKRTEAKGIVCTEFKINSRHPIIAVIPTGSLSHFNIVTASIGEVERRLERSDSKSIILPFYIANNLPLVASLLVPLFSSRITVLSSLLGTSLMFHALIK